MVGYVTDAVATALKNWSALATANVIPLRAAAGDSVVIDTPIPAIVVHVFVDENDGNTFIGGGIRHYFRLELHYIAPIINYSFSFDSGKQADMLDLSDEIIRCMERTKDLDYIKTRHDFSIQFDRMETSTTMAMQNANTVTVDVHKIIYRGSVEFDLYNDKEARPVECVTLNKVNILTD